MMLKLLQTSLAIFSAVIIIIIPSHSAQPEPGLEEQQRSHFQPHPRDAYVTLQYGEFLLGARVLAKSLLATNTSKELVVLCTDSVSYESRVTLQQDGWTVRSVDKIENPFEGTSNRANYFSEVYSKLRVWNLTEYNRVVFLDSDTLVVKNIDHLFDCGTFCAAFRHSDLFNSGVMVIEPSTAVFKDMIKKAPSLPSYDVGDQGFLNEYFNKLVFASMFNWSDSRRQYDPNRLPAGLNADIGMYYLAGGWKMPVSELRVIHYTLGPTKPWIWWANHLFDLNWEWTEFRRQLPENQNYGLLHVGVLHPIFWAPYVLILLLYLLLRYMECNCRWSFFMKNSHAAMTYFAFFNHRFSIFVPLPVVLASHYLAYRFIVPTTMLPEQAQYVFWLWSNFFLLLFMSMYCYLCHAVAKIRDNQVQSTSRKKLKSLMLYVLFCTAYIVFTLVPYIVAPFSSRVKAFFILLIFLVIVSQAAGHMAIKVWTKPVDRTASAHQRALPPKSKNSFPMVVCSQENSL